jgi:sporulation protein YlmC with PRC-barrel domain
MQSMAAEIRPKEMRTKLTHLSNLIGYKVLDANGEELGIASDYIINTCETYIIYILMEPAASLNMAPETRVVIPFEAVTINSGVLDAQNEAIYPCLLPEHCSQERRLFWPGSSLRRPIGRRCRRPSGRRQAWRLATSRNVMAPGLQGGLCHPTTGSRADDRGTACWARSRTQFGNQKAANSLYIVKPAEGDGYVLHLRAINIPKEALLPGAALALERRRIRKRFGRRRTSAVLIGS